MKNITLSVPDELLSKSREYAKRNGQSLNRLIRELLKKTVNEETVDYHRLHEELKVDTTRKYSREELYTRK